MKLKAESGWDIERERDEPACLTAAAAIQEKVSCLSRTLTPSTQQCSMTFSVTSLFGMVIKIAFSSRYIALTWWDGERKRSGRRTKGKISFRWRQKGARGYYQQQHHFGWRTRLTGSHIKSEAVINGLCGWCWCWWFWWKSSFKP